MDHSGPCKCRIKTFICLQKIEDDKFNAKVKSLQSCLAPLELFMHELKAGKYSNMKINSNVENKLFHLLNILNGKISLSINLKLLIDNESFLRSIEIMYNSHTFQGQLESKNGEILELNSEIEKYENKISKMKQKYLKFTSCSKCNSNFDKDGHEARLLKRQKYSGNTQYEYHGKVLCAECSKTSGYSSTSGNNSIPIFF